jgi:hypothetical protein
VVILGQLRAKDLDDPQCGPHPEQSEMKDFYEIEDWKQCELHFELIERMGTNDVSSLEKLSNKEGKGPPAIWTEMCLSRGFELCNIPERVFGGGRG